jgi:hypothetical protein
MRRNYNGLSSARVGRAEPMRQAQRRRQGPPRSPPRRRRHRRSRRSLRYRQRYRRHLFTTVLDHPGCRTPPANTISTRFNQHRPISRKMRGPPLPCGQFTGPDGVVSASCRTALVILRHVAAPSSSPSVVSSSARAALCSSALSPKRLSIRLAARQMSISGITGEGYRRSASDPEERRFTEA